MPPKWDDETCGKLAESESFDVRIRSVTRTVTSGVHREDDRIAGGSKPVSFEAHAIVWPVQKYIACQVSFDFATGGGTGPSAAVDLASDECSALASVSSGSGSALREPTEPDRSPAAPVGFLSASPDASPAGREEA